MSSKHKNNPKEWLIETIKGRTFDDFLCPLGWGRAKHRGDIPLVSKFSTNVRLNLPIVSANMDTVTESRFAITMAQEGGLGIIHRYLSIESECEEVAKTKRQHNHIIDNPYSVSPEIKVEDARLAMARHHVGGLMVVDNDGRLAGILTGRDIRYCAGDELVKDRMISVPRVFTAQRGEISLDGAKKFIDEHRLEKLPLVDEDFKLCGLITSKDIDNLAKYPLANKDANGRLAVGAAVGATGDYLERAAELIKAGVDVIVIDIANAQSDLGGEAVKRFRQKFPDFELVVGNIVLPMAVERYKACGVNGLKVGLGPGSACTTRLNTNIGVAQAQAVFDCSVNSEIPVCADGGIKRDGHACLALLLGASSVMIGGMFAATDETPGTIIRKSDKKKVKRYTGMASREAMLRKFFAEEMNDPYTVSSRINPEGIEKEVEIKGSAVPIIREMAGHIASMVSYMGALTLQEAKDIFMANPTKHLVKLSEAAKRESFDR